MTRGFYELLGVTREADLDEVRAAYGRAVAHLLKRREATLQHAGDTASLDLGRVALDEAWRVLSDPARRRRYDAMLAVVGEGVTEAEIDDLWPRISGAMIPPATAAAARIVDALTPLGLGPFPEPPVPDPVGTAPQAFGEPAPTTRVLRRTGVGSEDEGDDTAPFEAVDPTVPTQVPQEDPAPPGREARVAETGVRLAAFAQVPHDQAPVQVQVPASAGPSTVDVEALIEQHGFSGALVTAVREARGLSRQDLSARTSITPRYFEAIEREDLSALPTGVTYLRGYLRKTAELLGLDSERFVEGYIRRARDDE